MTKRRRAAAAAAAATELRVILLLACLVAASVVLVSRRQNANDYSGLHHSPNEEGGGSKGRVAHQRKRKQDHQERPSKLLPAALDMMRRGVPLGSAYSCFDDRRSFSIVRAVQRRRGSTRTAAATMTTRQSLERAAVLGRQCSCEGEVGSSGVDADGDPDVGDDELCCERRILTNHKMGTFLMMGALQLDRRFGVRRSDFEDFVTGKVLRDYVDEHLLDPVTDFRDVLVLRNIYSSLVSGYLYHSTGRECWLDWNGNAAKASNSLFPSPFTRDWRRFTPNDVDDDEGRYFLRDDDDDDSLLRSEGVVDDTEYPTLCHYLANRTEEEGMRVYIDWVFHAYYERTFNFWALTSSNWCPSIEKRTRTVCFEDLEDESSAAMSREVVAFLTHNASSAMSSRRQSSGVDSPAYSGGHATSKNPALRERLLNVVRQIDREHYNGEIAWLDSVLPC